MRKTIFLSLALCTVFFCGCRHLTLTSFETGETLQARAYKLTRNIYVTMSDGQVLKGKYAAVTNESIGFGSGSATAYGSGTSATAFGNSTSYAIGGPGSVYALLKSTKPGSHLMMELQATFDPLNGYRTPKKSNLKRP